MLKKKKYKNSIIIHTSGNIQYSGHSGKIVFYLSLD